MALGPRRRPRSSEASCAQGTVPALGRGHSSTGPAHPHSHQPSEGGAVVGSTRPAQRGGRHHLQGSSRRTPRRSLAAHVPAAQNPQEGRGRPAHCPLLVALLKLAPSSVPVGHPGRGQHPDDGRQPRLAPPSLRWPMVPEPGGIGQGWRRKAQQCTGHHRLPRWCRGHGDRADDRGERKGQATHAVHVGAGRETVSSGCGPGTFPCDQ